jgi:Flp pilus assembly protein TadB
MSFFLVNSSAQAGRGSGGAIAAGVAAGLFTGVATSAIANGGSKSRAEEKAQRAQDQTEQLRREQDRDKLDQIRRDVDKKELERKDEQIRQLNEHLKSVERQQSASQSNGMLYLLFGFIFLLSLAVGIMAFFLMRKR